MPTLGYTDATDATASGANLIGRGVYLTMPEDGIVSSMSAYVAESATANNHNVFLCVYEVPTPVQSPSTDCTLVDYSNNYKSITTTPGWITLTGFSGATLSKDKVYVLLLFNSVAVYLYRKPSSGNGLQRYTGFSNPTSSSTKATYTPANGVLSSQSHQFMLYLTYTVPGGALPRRALDGPLHIPLRGSVR